MNTECSENVKIPQDNPMISFDIDPIDHNRLSNLCGPLNEHIKEIERRLEIKIFNCGGQFKLQGKFFNKLQLGKELLYDLYQETGSSKFLDAQTVHLYIQEKLQCHDFQDSKSSCTDIIAKKIAIKTPKVRVFLRGINQKKYIKQIVSKDICFGIGPAGTGKTYLAVASAVQALEKSEVKRILLVRPAVEAGEKLGFLPGDLAQKIDPYLRPLYDALYEMLGFDRVSKLIEKNIIEIAPLAFMRGRTLNNSFIILDESQNTTIEQMKMFLTRIGFGSTTVITGDITQIDLPRGVQSGLIHAMHVLKNVDGIGCVNFSSQDVVRHPIVQKIVVAYHEYEQNNQKKQPRDLL